jgi:hypothetical protein
MRKPAIRGACIASALITLFAFGAVPALADKGGAGTETFTEHAHGEVLFSMPIVNPCTGVPSVLTAVAANEVFHATQQADGDFWITGTAEGTATLTPEEAGAATYSGHFASWFGAAQNNRNSVEHDTNTFVLRAADGSQTIIHIKDHLSTNANGVVTVEVERFDAHCR